MLYYTSNNIRQHFIDELKDEAFTIDKTGAKTIELIGASFIADEPALFGTPSEEYIAAELKWYESMSTNINDIYPNLYRDPPAAWQHAANKHGEINSNYGLLIYSPKYFNQLENVVDELQRNPDSRRACMVYNRPSIWKEYNENGKSDFICTNAVTYYIRNNELQAVVQMRSNDAVFGYKNDYAFQRYVMQEVCNEYNAMNIFEDDIAPGFMIWQVQNLHVYERHFHLVNP
jgi:thymidylate synthase